MTAAAPVLLAAADAELHWECGYRVHGYWRGDERLGHVRLTTPRGVQPVVYGWALDRRPIAGDRTTLKGAKRAVEAAWRLHESDPAVSRPTPPPPRPARRRPWWESPPRPRVGENCVRCRRWNPRFARKCSVCGVATSWALLDNVARFVSTVLPASGRDPKAEDVGDSL